MNYEEFLNHLERNIDKELVFEFEQHGKIRKDYHITEVFNVRVNAIDCGGEVDQWSETILQLVEPGYIDGTRFMESNKALKIIYKSDSKIKLEKNSEMILEYRPNTVSAAQRYHVSEILVKGNQIHVISVGSKTQCKAASRNDTVCGKSESSCCAPIDTSITQEKKSPCCS